MSSATNLQSGEGAMTDGQNSVEFLTGGGQMATAILAKDWAATPLGPIEKWPYSLRTTVSPSARYATKQAMSAVYSILSPRPQPEC